MTCSVRVKHFDLRDFFTSFGAFFLENPQEKFSKKCFRYNFLGKSTILSYFCITHVCLRGLHQQFFIPFFLDYFTQNVRWRGCILNGRSHLRQKFVKQKLLKMANLRRKKVSVTIFLKKTPTKILNFFFLL